MKGSWKQAKAYCSKADTKKPGGFSFYSDPATSQGHRSDLDDLREAIDNGMTSKLEISRTFAGETTLYACTLKPPLRLCFTKLTCA